MSMQPLKDPEVCPICRHEGIEFKEDDQGDLQRLHCKVCGEYEITGSALASIAKDSTFRRQRTLVAGVLRNAYERGAPLRITASNYRELADRAPSGLTVPDLLDRVLLYVVDHTSTLGDSAPVVWSDYSVFYLRRYEELQYLLSLLKDLTYLERYEGSGSPFLVQVGLEGWRRVADLQRDRRDSRRAFVAMWFDPSMLPAYTDGIQPALAAAGFEAVRIDSIEHVGKIDDRILSEIRRTGLLVADFTGQRAGVYFEAGFALGLGIPVVWTCREDAMSEAHFDTRQYNHLVWTTSENLRERLLNRIRATIPGAVLDDAPR